MLSEFIEYSMYFSKYIYAKRFKLKWVVEKKEKNELSSTEIKHMFAIFIKNL